MNATYRIVTLTIALATLPGVTFAQTNSLTRATIIMEQVQARSGPTTKFPPVLTMRRGDEIVIHHEEDGWLAILPPTGSVSWVKHLFLSEFDAKANGRFNAVILQNRVEPRYGTDLKSPPLEVQRIKLSQGTIVEVIGEKLVAENSTWYPIMPPENEYRYLPRNAVAGMSEMVQNPMPIAETNAMLTSQSTQVNAPPQAPPPIQHPFWTRAEEAERNGQLRDAEDAYLRMVAEIQRTGGSHDLVLLCYNRINRIRERKLPAVPASVQVIPTSNNPSTNKQPFTTASRQQQPPPQAVVVSRNVNDGQTSSSSVAQLQNSGPGVLRACGFAIDGMAAYVLENNRDGTRLYVTAQQGVNLQPYLGNMVELYGPMVYRGDIRGGNYMRVARVGQPR